MQTGQAIAHLALDFSARRQGSNGIDHDHIHGARTHQGVGNFQRLLARIGLGHQELVQIDTQLMGIGGIERMFGIDKGRRTACPLHLGHNMQGQGGLARAFRAIDFHHPATRQAANAKGHVQPQGPGRDRLDLNNLALIAELHHRALAIGPIDLCKRRLERALLICFLLSHESQHRLAHC